MEEVSKTHGQDSPSRGQLPSLSQPEQFCIKDLHTLRVLAWSQISPQNHMGGKPGFPCSYLPPKLRTILQWKEQKLLRNILNKQRQSWCLALAPTPHYHFSSSITVIICWAIKDFTIAFCFSMNVRDKEAGLRGPAQSQQGKLWGLLFGDLGGLYKQSETSGDIIRGRHLIISTPWCESSLAQSL